jgi:electron transport complex protein RnfC
MQTAVDASGCSGEVKVVTVKTKYPQGGERQLIKAVTGKTVPTGGIPPMIGVLVLNVATAAALAEAVVCDRPLTHRVVSVSGEAVAEPKNMYVPLGVTVRALLDFCGGVTEEAARVVMGGPMMGFALAELDTPITKTSGAVTVLTKNQVGLAKFKHRQTACIRCGRCLEVCPENLNPTKIAHAVKFNALDVAKDYYISGCIECGCCSYVCPANIELTGYIRTGKIHLAKRKKKA